MAHRRRKRNVSMSKAACTVGGSAHKSRSASARKCGTKWKESSQKFASVGGKAASRSPKSPIGKRKRRRRNPETTTEVEANPRRRRRRRRRNPEAGMLAAFNPAKLINPTTLQTALVAAFGAVVGGAAMYWYETRPAAGVTQGYFAPGGCPPGMIPVPQGPGRPPMCVPG